MDRLGLVSQRLNDCHDFKKVFFKKCFHLFVFIVFTQTEVRSVSKGGKKTKLVHWLSRRGPGEGGGEGWGVGGVVLPIHPVAVH